MDNGEVAKEGLKIFISAYACEPGLGSEIGVGWHWVLEMSKYFELWVLTRKSNRHAIEPWIKEHPAYAGIHFLYYDWPKWARFWKKGLRGVRTYYNIWQVCTNDLVKRTMQKNDIKIFHHLTYGNVLWKVSSYGQKQFFIWGPVGGLETIPEEFSRYYDTKSKWQENIRRLVVAQALHNIGLRRRCKRANLILCKTEITRDRLPLKCRNKAILFTDVATDISSTQYPSMSTEKKEKIEFVTVGHLDAWRGFDLVVEAMRQAVSKVKDIHLTIVGDGSDRERLQRLIGKYKLEHVITLSGKVSMETYKQLMRKADMVINAALKEGAVTVSFDSMAMGKPLLCLDTTGYTRYFSDDYAIVIPRGSREEVIEGLSRGIVRLTDSETRAKMGERAKEASLRFSWEHHGKEIRDAIMSAYTSYHSR